jgi:pyruvate,water dikinase
VTSEGWINDTGASVRFPVYTRSNANDVLPEPASPLGATLVWIPGVIEGWRDGNVRNGAFSAEELAGDPNPTCGFFNGYLYVNASVVRVFGERSGAGAAAIDAAFFGNRPDTPPYVAHPDDLSEEAAARIGAQMGWVMSATDFPELDASKHEADAARAARPDLSALSDAQLVAYARSMVPAIRRFFDDHVITSSNTAVGPTVLAQVTSAVDAGLMLRMIASSGDVDSALPSYAMWHLSREANASEEVSAAFDAGVPGLLDRLRRGGDDASAWVAHFDAFLMDYGCRGPNEWDPYYDSWETRPELALALIDRMRGVPDDDSPLLRHERVTADRDAATAEALAGLGDDETAKATALAAQASAQRFLAWRERSKTNCIKVINEVRVAMLELGRRMVAAGHLREAKDVFMLTDEELDAFVADPASYRTMLDERLQAWKALAELEPPYFVEGDKGIPPLSSLTRRGEESFPIAQPGDVLVGAPGCAGLVRGPARVITDPSDPFALEPGDILVAPQTDPAWTPLFVTAAGVVVGVGAMNSHAVTVSRELGIPCAVSVTGCASRIPDGALVEVDGGAGTVRML